MCVAQLADFGLSRVLEAHATHVSTKTYGTLAYMPGEHVHSQRVRGSPFQTSLAPWKAHVTFCPL